MTLPQNIAAGCLIVLAVWFGLFYVFPWLFLKVWHFVNYVKRHRRHLIVLLGVTASLRLMAGEAVLNIELRGGDVILFITGGATNVQYQIWSAPNPDQNVAAKDWYYWRHAYSRDYVSNPGYAEMIVYGANTSKQPQRFFQIRGVLPALKQR